jgi:hypothetical protein
MATPLKNVINHTSFENIWNAIANFRKLRETVINDR